LEQIQFDALDISLHDYSEEEVTVTDINDNEIMIVVPKEKRCQLKCLGCMKKVESVIKIRNNWKE
jgi:hypothetical protein